MRAFGGDENAVKLTKVMVAQLCKYTTKNHSVVHFKFYISIKLP